MTSTTILYFIYRIQKGVMCIIKFNFNIFIIIQRLFPHHLAFIILWFLKYFIVEENYYV